MKKYLRGIIGRNVPLRKLFYKSLGVLFLREWYVKRAIRKLPLAGREDVEILDAGSGFGQYSYYCAKQFSTASVLGLEVVPGHVSDCNRFARSAGLQRLRFEEFDITHLEYQDRFDLVLSVDVLEHIENDRDLISRFFDALKPDGHLVISTPTVYRSHHDDAGFVGEHVREGYQEEEIVGLFSAAGFRLESIVYGYGKWGDLSWRIGMRNAMRLASRGGCLRFFGILYLFLVSPVVLPLMGLDFIWKNRRGTSIIVVAQKPE